MFSFYDQLPKYLLGKYQLISTVLFTALFSIVFIIVSVPFSHNVWFNLDGGEAFAFTVVFFIIALAVVAVSKRIMYGYDKPLLYWQYIVWNTLEVIVICLLYSFFTMEGGRTGILDLGELRVEDVFLSALVYVTVSLGVPYIIAGQYFAIEDMNNTIRLMNLGSVVGDMELPPIKEKRITLFDNSGVLKFSVEQSNLIYIESDDNYVKVWYLDGASQLRQYMLRCRLKTIEDSFKDSELVRCHRKYVVNVSKIKVLQKDRDNYLIDLGLDEPIPVSKTYEDALLTKFNSR